MQDVVCYILNRYYLYYRAIVSYPYLSSELRNLDCLKNGKCTNNGCVNETYCCALSEEVFKEFCTVFTKVNLENFYKVYKCCKNKLRGDMYLRRDIFDYDNYNKSLEESCLKMAIFASFTHPRGNTDKITLLNSLIEMCIHNKFDKLAKEYITQYADKFNEDVFIDTDLGEMLNQTLEIIKKYSVDSQKFSYCGFIDNIRKMLTDCKANYNMKNKSFQPKPTNFH